MVKHRMTKGKRPEKSGLFCVLGEMIFYLFGRNYNISKNKYRWDFTRLVYSATEIAKYVVNKCTDDKHPISNLHLQKILYYIQKEYLRSGDIAFGEDIEAWRFGPAVPIVYYEFAGSGAMPIDAKYDTFIKWNDRERIDRIVEEKRALNPWDLVAESHRPCGPWASIYQDGKGYRHVIPIDLIREKG